MRIPTFLIGLGTLLLVACESAEDSSKASSAPTETVADTLVHKDTMTITRSDTTQLPAPVKEPEITPTKQLKKKQVEVIPETIEAVPDDFHIYDPFEDPNYVGTPCGDFIDGKCTRHPHPEYDEEEFQP